MSIVVGMLPSSFALGEGGGVRAPMSRAVIGGLITSTILTLIVVPVGYTYFEDMSAWVCWKFGRRKKKETEPPVLEPALQEQ